MFPLKQLANIQANPDKYRLLQEVPFLSITDCPHRLAETVGDELLLCVIDTETTGFSETKNEMIEFGWTKCLYSPSADAIIEILSIGSMYQEPSAPIPELITQITGITDDMVKGHTFDLPMVADVLLNGEPLVLAHNKSFDSRFIEGTFGQNVLFGKSIKWGCTVNDIDWKAKGFASKSLEMLLLSSGYFYPAHRASIDCLALTHLLNITPNAINELIASVETQFYTVDAIGSPFDSKDILKANGFKWNADAKVWQRKVTESDVERTKGLLTSLYHLGGQQARITPISIVTEY